MAIKHNLALDIPDTACINILKINDASVYGKDLAVDCPRLTIFLPGFSTPLFITKDLPPAFTRNISMIDLERQSADCDVLDPFPDGLYKIGYSVSPNDKVFVEYYHLRVTDILNTYYAELCKVQLQTCEPTPEQHQKMHDLRYIKMYIDAAKAKAEYCHAPVQATDMLDYAKKLLDKYQTGCCVTCGH